MGENFVVVVIGSLVLLNAVVVVGVLIYVKFGNLPEVERPRYSILDGYADQPSISDELKALGKRNIRETMPDWSENDVNSAADFIEAVINNPREAPRPVLELMSNPNISPEREREIVNDPEVRAWAAKLERKKSARG